MNLDEILTDRQTALRIDSANDRAAPLQIEPIEVNSNLLEEVDCDDIMKMVGIIRSRWAKRCERLGR